MESPRLTSPQTVSAQSARTVVLVEGISDKVALEALARRRGRNLVAEDVSIVPIGGAQAIGRFLERFGPPGLDVRLAGLCATLEKRPTSDAVSSGPGSAPTSLEPTWNDWASTSATQTWKTS